MNVAAILKAKGSDVVTIHPKQTMADAVRLFGHHNVGALVVSSDERAVEGLVSERDVVRFVGGPAAIDFDLTVTDVATAAPPVCDPGDHVESVMAVMTNERFRHLPVVSDGSLRGIISIGDVVKWRVAELENANNQLETYITGVPH